MGALPKVEVYSVACSDIAWYLAPPMGTFTYLFHFTEMKQLSLRLLIAQVSPTLQLQRKK